MEHIKVIENVVCKLCTKDEKTNTSAILDPDDADCREPPAWLSECLFAIVG